MKGIHLTQEEIEKYPLFYHGKSNEAEIREYNSQELLKIFHFYNQNKIDTLKCIDQKRKDLERLPEFLLFKKYIYGKNDLITGILIEKGYPTNLRTYKINGASFNDLILVLQNIGKILETLNHLRTKENILTDFFIGDLQESNILVDSITKKVQIIDLNSCKIGNNRAFLTKYLNFLKTYTHVRQNLGKKYPWDKYNFSNNQNTDLYCYSVIILKVLFSIDISILDLNTFYKMMYKLKQENLPEPLFQIFLNLYNNVDNDNPFRYLENIPHSFEKELHL